MDILDKFEKLHYKDIVDYVDEFLLFKLNRKMDFDVKELAAIGHSYFEMKRYDLALYFCKETLREVVKSKEDVRYMKEAELAMIDIIVCNRKMEKRLSEYTSLVRYKLLGFGNVQIINSLSKVEASLSKSIITGINMGSMGLIVVYLVFRDHVAYKYLFLIYILGYFIQAVSDYFYPEFLNKAYSKIIRGVIVFFVKRKLWY